MNLRTGLFFSFRGPDIPPRGIWIIVFAAIALLCAGIRMEAHQNGHTASAPQNPPEQYLNARTGVEYLGDECCRKCHSTIYKQFKQTGMGRSVSVSTAEDLRELATPVRIVNKKLNR